MDYNNPLSYTDKATWIITMTIPNMLVSPGIPNHQPNGIQQSSSTTE